MEVASIVLARLICNVSEQSCQFSFARIIQIVCIRLIMSVVDSQVDFIAERWPLRNSFEEVVVCVDIVC